MSTGIVSTDEIAEQAWDGHSDPAEPSSDMAATREPAPGISFHVQMRGHTLRDMEELIVEAAARELVGRRSDNALAKLIEERCIALITSRIDSHLAKVTAEIIDQPIVPQYPFMKPAEKPMTMREFIGLTGRDYLEARVDNDGKPTADRSYSKPRMQLLVERTVGATYKREIEHATGAAISEIQKAIREQHAALLNQEKARLRDALARAT